MKIYNQNNIRRGPGVTQSNGFLAAAATAANNTAATTITLVPFC